jgi:hypothetical protein
LRQEIRKETKLEQASEEKEDTGQQGDHARESDVPGAGDWSQAGEAAGKYSRSSGIGSDHEIARRTKDGERNEGKQKRVEPSDDGCASNSGVAKRLRNVQGRKRKSGQQIPRYLRPLKRPQTLEDREAIREPI